MKIAASHPLGNAARPITGFAGGLGPKEYLVRPAHHAGKVVTRQVMKQGWGGPHLDDTYDLRIVVRKLRKTIEVDPTRLRMLTELGIGYRLVQ